MQLNSFGNQKIVLLVLVFASCFCDLRRPGTPGTNEHFPLECAGIAGYSSAAGFVRERNIMETGMQGKRRDSALKMHSG